MTTIPIEKPNVQTSATPPKPASIASDKDAPGAVKPGQRAAQNPAKNARSSRQKTAPASQPKRQIQQESFAAVISTLFLSKNHKIQQKEEPKQAEETTENTEEEPGWVTVEIKKKVRDNKSETSDTDDAQRTQKVQLSIFEPELSIFLARQWCSTPRGWRP